MSYTHASTTPLACAGRAPASSAAASSPAPILAPMCDPGVTVTSAYAVPCARMSAASPATSVTTSSGRRTSWLTAV